MAALQATKLACEDRLKEIDEGLLNSRRTKRSCEKAMLILQEVGQAVQDKFRVKIEGLVSLALASVFDNPYSLSSKFTASRGKVVAVLKFDTGKGTIDPMTASGFGVVDVASLALRISLLCMAKTSRILVLDEPFRFLSKDLQYKAGQLIQDLSRRLKIQFIIITHSKELATFADKTFLVKKTGYGKSTIQEELK